LKYMLLHYVGKSVAEETHLDPQTESDLNSWLEEMADRGVHLDGDRLRAAADATTVRLHGDELLIADGPFAETKEQVAGYDVIECADLDDAVEIASRHPTARLGTIEIRPFLEGWRAGQ